MYIVQDRRSGDPSLGSNFDRAGVNAHGNEYCVRIDTEMGWSRMCESEESLEMNYEGRGVACRRQMR